MKKVLFYVGTVVILTTMTFLVMQNRSLKKENAILERKLSQEIQEKQLMKLESELKSIKGEE